jgi:hypothetical protein
MANDLDLESGKEVLRVWEPALGPIPLVRVLRLCGYRDPGAARARQDQPKVARILSEVRGALAPAAAVRLIDNRFRSAIFPDCGQVVCGLVTVGSAIDACADAYVRQGRIFDGLACDAVGSVAVELLAHQINVAVNAGLWSQGRTGGRRRSPGYGKWPVEAQAELLALLPASRIGVSLTTGLMMSPRKTVSFAIPVHPGHQPADAGPEGCCGCGLPACTFRRNEGVPA